MDSLARDSSFTSILSILLSSFLRPRKTSLSTAPVLIDYKIATRSFSSSMDYPLGIKTMIHYDSPPPPPRARERDTPFVSVESISAG